MLTERGQPRPTQFFDQPVERDDVDPGHTGRRLGSQCPSNAEGDEGSGAHHQSGSERVDIAIEDSGEVSHGPSTELAGDDLAHAPTLNPSSDIYGASVFREGVRSASRSVDRRGTA